MKINVNSSALNSLPVLADSSFISRIVSPIIQLETFFGWLLIAVASSKISVNFLESVRISASYSGSPNSSI